jgi:hypothetical protein
MATTNKSNDCYGGPMEGRDNARRVFGELCILWITMTIKIQLKIALDN